MNERDFKLSLIHGFLIANFDDFYTYLEDIHEIEGTEAEVIMTAFEEMFKEQPKD